MCGRLETIRECFILHTKRTNAALKRFQIKERVVAVSEVLEIARTSLDGSLNTWFCIMPMV